MAFLARVSSIAVTTWAKIGSTSRSASRRFNFDGYWTRIFSVFSRKVAIRVFKVSSLSSARFSAEAAARFKMRATSVSYKEGNTIWNPTISMTYVGALEVQNQVDRCDDFLEGGSLRLLTWVAIRKFILGLRSIIANVQTYPSIRKPVEFWTFPMAAASSSSTTSLLTSPPFDIVSWSSLPLGEPEATSARSKSPVDKCENLYLATMRSHCVPLPQPGPPSTQMIGTLESIT